MKDAIIDCLFKAITSSTSEAVDTIPMTLLSLAHLIDPSWTKLRNLFFTIDDLHDLLKYLETVSFKLSLKEEFEKNLEYFV